ncbi:MAG: phosphotransferase [Myxococcales bacterium]|nr:phosphotransferase [Myxococcales bacterium]
MSSSEPPAALRPVPDPGPAPVLHTREDFQRFCADLRRGAPDLDELVEGLRALAASTLGSRDKGRFARSIAQHLRESFHAAEVLAVASVPWPLEIKMAIRTQVGAEGEPPPAPAAATAPEADPREIYVEVGSPTVVFLGDEDEHRASMEHLHAEGFHCLRQGTLEALEEVFAREVVVGLVVGSSFWSQPDPGGQGPQSRLARVLRASNLCWTKLTRSAAWAAAQEQLPQLCTRLYLRPPPIDRLSVEDQASISKLEIRCLADAARDILYAERNVEYEFQPSIVQDRIIRAVTSRHLRERYPAVHRQEPGLRVRSLADRGAQGLVGLVSVVGQEVSFVVKVSPYDDAVEEARRFRMFASGAPFEMEFYCHASLGALVFAPVEARLGQARSLEDVLAAPGLTLPAEARPEEADLLDAAVAALERFSRQVRPVDVTTYADLDPERTRVVLDACPRLVVAGVTVDVRRLYRRGVEVLDRSSGAAVVHGDAHPGNILFGANRSAVLIDYECAGLGPPCCDPCTLWIVALASSFVAVGDERATVGLLEQLLRGASFEALVERWSETLVFAVNYQGLYLARRALDASAAMMRARGLPESDVLGVVSVILCRALHDVRLQQLVIRCALAATQAVLDEAEDPRDRQPSPPGKTAP